MSGEWLNNIFYLSPLLVLAATAIFSLLLSVFHPHGSKWWVLGLSFSGLLISLITSVQLWYLDPRFLFNEAIKVDHFALFFTELSLFLTFLTFLTAYPSIKENLFPVGEFSFFLLSACLGMSLMAWSTDLMTLFLSLETMSISAYVLTGFRKDRLTSLEGALKYFLLGAFSTGFLLYGIVLIYACTGATQFSSIGYFLMNSQFTIPAIFYVGVALLIIGMAFKIAAVPFHMWVPDVYEGAPTSVTALMATGIKAASFAAIIRFFLVPLLSIKGNWEIIVFVLAIATMTVGNIAALVQNNIKRMLAYSSIAHAGYILIALTATNSQIFNLSIGAILFYLLAYGLMTIGAFSVLIYGAQTQERNNLQDYAGFGFKYPYLGIAMTIFMASLIGLPPTAGFMGKFYIFSSALNAQLYSLAIIGMINSVISSYYYLRVVVVFYMKDAEAQQPTLEYSPIIMWVLLITGIGTLLLGIFPTRIFQLITSSVTSLL